VEPSEEIRRIVERWMTAISVGDAETILERFSEHSGAVIIGTDPDEWWHGFEARAIWVGRSKSLTPSW
jgi:hypothetical protein